MGVGFLVIGIGIFATSSLANPGTKEAPIRTAYTDIWGWVWFATFVAGVVISFITNKKWLIWKAHANEVKWYAAAGTSQALGASPVRGYDPNAAAAAFSPQPLSVPAPQQFSTPAPQAPATVDVNSASAQELVTALGVDGETAGRILQARQAVGSFTSFEQLMTRAQVPPHLLIPHRDKIAFGAPSDSAPAAPPQPRTLDPTSRKARRLFD